MTPIQKLALMALIVAVCTAGAVLWVWLRVSTERAHQDEDDEARAIGLGGSPSGWHV